MKMENRINAFATLGQRLNHWENGEKEALYDRVQAENPWFTTPNLDLAFRGIQKFLTPEKLHELVSGYTFKSEPKKVGVAMAGNIPLVGFHDLLCVLLSGHSIVIKPSSQDSVLIRFIKDQLIDIEPAFAEKIFIEERLNHVDALIATGSDNTARYFEYYFRKIPHIIRKNRSSCAILVGEEPAEELSALGNDVFSYFGLGCRNVSKLFVPADYKFDGMFRSWENFSSIIHHHKYANNYDYRKSIYLVNRDPFFDNGFVLITENKALVSPISVLFFEYYEDQKDLHQKMEEQKDKIQCIVSAQGWWPGSVGFGQAQFPDVADFADGVNTLAFLQSL
jgi:hypothetical protein